MAARTPSIHVFLGRPLYLLSPGIHDYDDDDNDDGNNNNNNNNTRKGVQLNS
jgi:hypothetical protein